MVEMEETMVVHRVAAVAMEAAGMGAVGKAAVATVWGKKAVTMGEMVVEAMAAVRAAELMVVATVGEAMAVEAMAVEAMVAAGRAVAGMAAAATVEAVWVGAARAAVGTGAAAMAAAAQAAVEMEEADEEVAARAAVAEVAVGRAVAAPAAAKAVARVVVAAVAVARAAAKRAVAAMAAVQVEGWEAAGRTEVGTLAAARRPVWPARTGGCGGATASSQIAAARPRAWAPVDSARRDPSLAAWLPTRDELCCGHRRRPAARSAANAGSRDGRQQGLHRQS